MQVFGNPDIVTPTLFSFNFFPPLSSVLTKYISGLNSTVWAKARLVSQLQLCVCACVCVCIPSHSRKCAAKV